MARKEWTAAQQRSQDSAAKFVAQKRLAQQGVTSEAWHRFMLESRVEVETLKTIYNPIKYYITI